MNTRSRTIQLLLLLVIMALAGAGLVGIVSRERGGDVEAAETSTQRTVTVSGQGQVAVPPDVVKMNLGVDISDPDLAVAQSTAAQRMDAILAALAGQGVQQTDIQTATYSIYTDRDYTKTDAPVTGYHIYHTVIATVRDTARAGQVLQAAIDAGANSVGGVWFALENPGDAVGQARERAVADARAKAEDLARLTGASLGPVLTISETSSGPVVPATGARDEATGGGSVPINAGQTEVTVTVTIAWAIN